MTTQNINDVDLAEIEARETNDIDLEDINNKLSGMDRVTDIFIETDNNGYLLSVTVELASNIGDMVSEAMYQNDLIYHQSYVQSLEDQSLPQNEHTHRVEFIPKTDATLKASTATETAEEFETVEWC